MKKVKIFGLLASLALVAGFALTACFNGGGSGTITWEVGWEPGEPAIEVTAGDWFDPRDGMAATCTVDGDITDRIVVLNENDHEAELKANGWWDEYRVFNPHVVGASTVHFMVTNSAGNTSFATRNFIVRQRHNWRNSDFSQGNMAWGIDQPGGRMTRVINNATQQAELTITNPGSAWWALQFQQSGVRLAANTAYRISIRARSPQRRSISFNFENIDASFAMMAEVVSKQLDTTFTDFITYFRTGDQEFTNVKAAIYFGAVIPEDITGLPHRVYIEHAFIEEVQFCEAVVFEGVGTVTGLHHDNWYMPGETPPRDGAVRFDPMEGVSASLNLTGANEDLTDDIVVIGHIPRQLAGDNRNSLIYVIRHQSGKVSFVQRTTNVTVNRAVLGLLPHQPVNGDFSAGLGFWTQDVNQTEVARGDATFTHLPTGGPTGGPAVRAAIVTQAGADWMIQFWQQGISLNRTESYVISFDIKASQPVPFLNVEFVQQGGTNPVFGVFGQRPITAANEWQTITWEAEWSVDHAGAYNRNMRLGFQIGRALAGTQITIANVTINQV